MSGIYHIPEGSTVNHLTASDATLARLRRECIEDAASTDPLIAAAARRLHLAVIEAQILRANMAVIVSVPRGASLKWKTAAFSSVFGSVTAPNIWLRRLTTAAPAPLPRLLAFAMALAIIIFHWLCTAELK
jgi:hypothetical protein